MSSQVVSHFFPEYHAGGFTRVDGTVEFYTRVNSLLHPDMLVVDYGAGRGSGQDEPVAFKRSLRTFTGKVKKVIGVDVDVAVRENPLVDEAIVIAPDASLPFQSASVDLILADAVFEHLEKPERVAQEFDRVLKPGGWICARTPNRWGYIGLSTNLIPNRLHAPLLRHLQPDRKLEDIFPTRYRLNTRTQIRRHFPVSQYDDYTYTWNAEPAYFADYRPLWSIMMGLFRLCPESCGAFLYVFLNKRFKSDLLG